MIVLFLLSLLKFVIVIVLLSLLKVVVAAESIRIASLVPFTSVLVVLVLSLPVESIAIVVLVLD